MKQKRKVHLLTDSFDTLAFCGKKADRSVDTENEKKLTCKKCKSMLRVPKSQRWGAK